MTSVFLQLPAKTKEGPSAASYPCSFRLLSTSQRETFACACTSALSQHSLYSFAQEQQLLNRNHILSPGDYSRGDHHCAPEGNRQRHAPAACGGRTAPKHTGLVSRRVLLPNNTEIKIIDHSAIAQHNQHHADRTHSPGRQEPYARRGARAQPYVETTMRPQSPGLSLTISAIQMRFLSSVVASVKPN